MKEKRPRSSAKETHERVLTAARIAFCQASFDHVGLREIATRAGTDPTIVIRLFGSKEALFQEVAKDAFNLEPAFEVAPQLLGESIANLLLGADKRPQETDEFDAFRFLFNSALSPVAAPIVSANLHANFVTPLASRLGGDDAVARAGLITACVLGVTTMCFALNSPALNPSAFRSLHATFAKAIQSCVDS